MKIIWFTINAEFFLLFLSLISAEDFLILKFSELQSEYEIALNQLSKVPLQYQTIEVTDQKKFCTNLFSAKVLLQDDGMVHLTKKINKCTELRDYGESTIEMPKGKIVVLFCLCELKTFGLYIMKSINDPNRFFVLYQEHMAELIVLGLAEVKPSTFTVHDVEEDKRELRKYLRKVLTNDAEQAEVQKNLIRFSQLSEEQQYRLCFWIFTFIYSNYEFEAYVIEAFEKSFINESIKLGHSKHLISVDFIACQIAGKGIGIIPNPLNKTDVILMQHYIHRRMTIGNLIGGVPAMP